MKKYKNIIIFLAVAVLTAALVYGIRAWRVNQAEHGVDGRLDDGLLEESVTQGGERFLVPPNQIHTLDVSGEDIPAVNEPAFDSVSEADEYLSDNVHGISVEVDGDHRFYSYQILNWHIVVNDTFNEKELAVTLCPLCRSAVVYERVFNGEDLTFNATGQLYNNNLFLKDDKSGSLWLQARGTAVSGEHIGKELSTYPHEVMTWADWKDRHPTGRVLSTETGQNFDYTRHPYGSYDTNTLIYFPLNHVDDRMKPKWVVNAVEQNREHLAYADPVMAGFGAVNNTVGGVPVIGVYDFELEFTRVFSADPTAAENLPENVEINEALLFDYSFTDETYTDRQTGSVWSTRGTAVEGPLTGTQLAQLEAPEMFWFCRAAMRPDTKAAKVDAEERGENHESEESEGDAKQAEDTETE